MADLRKRSRVRRIAIAALAAIGLAAALLTVGVGRAPATTSKACSSGYVHANLDWGEKCLRVGELCKTGNPEYHAYGFDCPSGRLVASSSSSSSPAAAKGTSIALGRTLLFRRPTRTRSCLRGVVPDRRCSPGGYYSGLTKAVLCSPAFRTSSVRNVPPSEKYAVERMYGMAPRPYGRTIEIDHIVSLELGGSNDIANLFPEPGSGAASYHRKDLLENRLHHLVCAGAIGLRAAQRGIATNWRALFVRLFGVAP